MIVYTDDGYIKTKLSIDLQVLSELKAVFKVDAVLELNVSKTSILPPKGVTRQVVFDVPQGIITASPDLTHLSDDLAMKVSLALVCLLVRTSLYRVLCLKNVGIS